ncbi:Gfo/Idh/MocA family protein [Marinifilum caeruleilacunae]|uniref:Gfo/Idh/MocA family oxidoreductase n=1 Tax=Marinifilum caeruleilacunae TaxID=2499076 RepID=A0ABX1WT98_9BACT|nr:Gfo/Idh/MocA family oxidoreductase [Marinifilum caeruleilacunae]NOU59227.1 Gfo/Idh/MocA family oxidoreductase [Marinifilum caeruleilacunae]
MIRIGIICPSEIAFRRFMPALKKANGKFEFVGIAVASPEEWFGNLYGISNNAITEQQRSEREKAESFIEIYGGRIFNSYKSILESESIDAIYIPLPPALHYKWAKMALRYGKHVFVEKPSTTCAEETADLIKIAKEKGLTLHENYMFVYHRQLREIQDVVESGEIGDIRLYRISFGFPRRAPNDFRYIKSLGGGALLDAGGYTIKYATYLIGQTAKLTTAQVNYIDEFEVDMFGSATMVNHEGVTAQLAFGMDNDYKCEIEIWGSNGTITSNRILTAPPNFVPSYTLKKNQELETRDLSSDDTFEKSIECFYQCINDESKRVDNYLIIQRQADLISQFKKLAVYQGEQDER